MNISILYRTETEQIKSYTHQHLSRPNGKPTKEAVRLRVLKNQQ